MKPAGYISIDSKQAEEMATFIMASIREIVRRKKDGVIQKKMKKFAIRRFFKKIVDEKFVEQHIKDSCSYGTPWRRVRWHYSEDWEMAEEVFSLACVGRSEVLLGTHFINVYDKHLKLHDELITLKEKENGN